MPVDHRAPVGQPDAPSGAQPFERGARLLGERLGDESGPSKRQLRGLNADQPDHGAIVEHQGVAVDHLAHRGAAAVGEVARRRPGR